MLETLFPFMSDFDASLLVKIPVLIIVFLYVVFAFILFNKTRVLGRIVFIEASGVTSLLKSLTFFHFLATVLLFLLALVIL